MRCLPLGLWSVEWRQPLGAEARAGSRDGQLLEHRGLPLERLLLAFEGMAVGQLAWVEVTEMSP
jgi:hypothetical protein